MKRTILAATLMLALLVPAAHAGRHQIREQSQRDVDPAGLVKARVENGRGDVVLEPSPDARLHVVALKEVRAGTSAEARRMADEMKVETRAEGGQFVVRVRYPSRQSIRIGFWDLFSDFEVPSSTIRITLRVPGTLPVSVRTSSGDIESDDLPGAQTLESTSGDVDVTGAAGPVEVGCTSGDVQIAGARGARVRTVSGDVVATSAAGVLDIHTTSGDVTVRDAADSLVLGTVTGDVSIHGARRGLKLTTTSGEVLGRDLSGPVAVGASSGDVDLAVRAPFGGMAVTTSSGDIHVRLAEGLDVALELRTSNGTLQLDPGVQVATLTRRVVTGRVGKGITPIVLRSASGDIQVTTGGDEQ